jgi:hypothetical protein
MDGPLRPFYFWLRYSPNQIVFVGRRRSPFTIRRRVGCPNPATSPACLFHASTHLIQCAGKLGDYAHGFG